MRFAVKFSDPDETMLQGLAAPFSGPFRGKDLDGEFFSPRTDFALDWYDQIPLLFHHGRDETLETTVVGRVKSRALTDTGAWAEAQLDASSKYFDAIKKLVKAGKLFFSSAAPPHLVQTDAKTGEILRWPWYELSLTPTPANMFATTEIVAAKAHFSEAGLLDEWAKAEAELDTTKAMPDGGTPVDGDDNGDPPEGSYEDLIADLNRALRLLFAGGGVQVLATFPTYAIAAVYSDNDYYSGPSPAAYFSVEYTLDQGEPVLGDTTPVSRMYVPDTDAGAESDDDAADTMVIGQRAIDLDRLFTQKATLTAAQRKRIPDEKFGYVDDKGKGHFPLTDEKHVRAALSLFGTADFPDAATKKACAGKIIAAARRLKIDVGSDTDVAMAAKSARLPIAPAAPDQPTTVKAAPAPAPTAGETDAARLVLAQLDADLDAILARPQATTHTLAVDTAVAAE